MVVSALAEPGFATQFRQMEVAKSSHGPRELSLTELDFVAGGDVNWGSVYQSATAGMIGGAVSGAIAGGIAGSFAGGIGAGPGALSGGLGGAVGGAVAGGLTDLFRQMAR